MLDALQQFNRKMSDDTDRSSSTKIPASIFFPRLAVARSPFQLSLNFSSSTPSAEGANDVIYRFTQHAQPRSLDFSVESGTSTVKPAATTK